MTTTQVIFAAVVLAAVCCAVMWFLEDFRQRKLIAEMQTWLAGLPTAAEGGQS
jgi:hypothetical protein